MKGVGGGVRRRGGFWRGRRFSGGWEREEGRCSYVLSS